jgi:hypothetical protein
VFEVVPVPRVDRAVLLGTAGTIEQTGQGAYRVIIKGPQGHEQQFAILLPSGEKVSSVTYSPPAEVWANTEVFSRQLVGKLMDYESRDSIVWGKLRMPRKEVQPEVRTWSQKWIDIDSGLQDGLPKGGWIEDQVTFSGRASDAGLGGFAGMYVENLFQEEREVILKVSVTKNDTRIMEDILTQYKKNNIIAADAMKEKACVWYATQVDLPFVHRPDLQQDPNRHLYMPLLLHRYRELNKPKVWINGSEVPVHFFKYARVDDGCFYVDGTEGMLRSSKNKIVIYLQHK